MPEKQIYFIGLALPEPLNSQLSRLSHDLHAKYKGLPPPLLPHITLLHPPSLHQIVPAEIVPKIRVVAKKYLPFDITLTEVGFFNTQVCFIHVMSPALHSLHAELVKLLPDDIQSIHYGKRSYITHITLARTRKPRSLDKSALLHDINSAIKLPSDCTIFEVSHFERYAPRMYHANSI
jgi:2'-5' RNA ligase